MTGFNGAHWPLWPLLQAAVLSAEKATVFLDDPSDAARDIDETWVGTWEEAFGEAKPVSLPMNQITDSLFSEAEMRGASVGPLDQSFLVGADTTEQAEVVAQKCLHFLADPACDRVGIILPGAGALARLVANALVRLDIPHYDVLAHFLPGIFEAADWRAWLRLQESPRINSLLHFVNAFSDRGELFPGLSLNAFRANLALRICGSADRRPGHFTTLLRAGIRRHKRTGGCGAKLNFVSPRACSFSGISSRNKIRVQPTRVEVALDGDRATNRRLGR